MVEKIFFVTGVSSGIGEALMDIMLEDASLNSFGIGRRNPNGISNFLTLDLSNQNEVSEFRFPKLLDENVKEVCLINNAGSIGTIGSILDQNQDEITNVFQINLLSLIQLSNLFINQYKSDFKLKIVNISSGAAYNPITGWAPYCASKSGLEMYSRALQQEAIHFNIDLTVYSIAPGVVDSKMQSVIRSSSENNFPDLEKFKALKTENALIPPSIAAFHLLKVMNENHEGGVFSLRDFY